MGFRTQRRPIKVEFLDVKVVDNKSKQTSKAVEYLIFKCFSTVAIDIPFGGDSFLSAP